MSTLVYMKMLERTQAKYDQGMRLLTLEREIASAWVEPGHSVLEIGCGTGSLAALLGERGARVVGTDISEQMLAVARDAAPEAELIHLTVTEIDRLGSGRFDRIVATLTFSELSDAELDYVLRASTALLKTGGMLVVADEVQPTVRWQRILCVLMRWPLAVLTFLLTQETTRALKGFEKRLEDADYLVQFSKRYLWGTLALILAEKHRG